MLGIRVDCFWINPIQIDKFIIGISLVTKQCHGIPRKHFNEGRIRRKHTILLCGSLNMHQGTLPNSSLLNSFPWPTYRSIRFTAISLQTLITDGHRGIDFKKKQFYLLWIFQEGILKRWRRMLKSVPKA